MGISLYLNGFSFYLCMPLSHRGPRLSLELEDLLSTEDGPECPLWVENGILPTIRLLSPWYKLESLRPSSRYVRRTTLDIEEETSVTTQARKRNQLVVSPCLSDSSKCSGNVDTVTYNRPVKDSYTESLNKNFLKYIKTMLNLNVFF